MTLSPLSSNPQEVTKSIEEAKLSALDHPSLLSNTQYNDLRRSLMRFYNDRRSASPSMHRGKTVVWKENLYRSLYSLMLEIVATDDPKQQSVFLVKVYNWYMDKIKDKSTKPSSITPVKSEVSRNIMCISRVPLKNSNTKEDFLAKLNARYANTREREKVDMKFREERQHIVEEWARSKSRASAERTRRYLQQKLTTDRSETHSKSPLIHDFRTEKEIGVVLNKNISFIRKKYQALFDDETGKYSQMSQTTKILKQPPRMKIDEVLNTKNKLARKKMVCSFQKLHRGLLLPEKPLDSSINPSLFPKGGERLFSPQKNI